MSTTCCSSDTESTVIELPSDEVVVIPEQEAVVIVHGQRGLDGVGGATKTTLLTLIAGVPANTLFSVIASSGYYTKTLDDGYLGEDQDAFIAEEHIQVYLNGLNLIKGSEVLWETPTSFKISSILDIDDIIKVLSA